MKEHLVKKKSSFDYRPCCSDHEYFIVLGELYCEARVLKPGRGRKRVTLKGAAFLGFTVWEAWFPVLSACVVTNCASVPVNNPGDTDATGAHIFILIWMLSVIWI